MLTNSTEAFASSGSLPASSAAGIVVPKKAADAPAEEDLNANHRSIDGQEGGKDGEEGDSPTAFATFTPTNAAFLNAIFTELPQGARPAIIAKPGDPETGGWAPRDAKHVQDVCRSDHNTYFNCSSLTPTEEGKLAARKDLAAAYHALVLDDVETKVDRSLLGGIQATWELETSPGNFQIGFRLSPPLRTADEVERLQKRIANAGLTDIGALGMVRWARLPDGINGKPKYEHGGKPFSCRLHKWAPNTSYTADQIVQALAPQEALPPTDYVTATGPKRSSSSGSRNNGVFTPPAKVHPVVTALRKQGLHKREISPGKHDITCPWAEEHTDALDTGAAYFEPDSAFATGGFCCQHSHKDDYHISELLNYLGLNQQQARNRPTINLVAGELDTIFSACEGILAEQGDHYQSGGMIVTVNVDPISGDPAMSPVNESALTRKLARSCDWQRFDEKKACWVRCDPPQRHVALFNKAEAYEHIPILQGLARQPYYRDTDGQLLFEPGYDPVSRRLGVFDRTKYLQPTATRDAALEALESLKELIAEFHFAEEVDRAAALSAIFTAVTRPTLGLAPAFHVTAPSSGSGKSYLCETIALFAGPGAPAKTSYPKTSEEATKSMLSLLLAAPAVIEFDDMDTDWLPHGTINRMLTAQSITDRILGVSKVATVGTSVLFLGSGNNVGPIKDLARRVVTVHLNAKSESPATLRYAGNPVALLRAQRERYVSAVLTIIEAWKAAGSPKAPVPSIASYGGKWSDYCRQSLIWLGLPDPATALLDQITQDPDSDVLLQLLREWYASIGDKPTTVRNILSDSFGTELYDAFMDLPVVEVGKINRSRLGRYLGRNRDRIVGGFMLQEAPNSERRTWKVVKVAKGEAPPSPPKPPISPVICQQSPPVLDVENKF